MDFNKEKQARFYPGEIGKPNFESSWQIQENQFPEHKISASLLMIGAGKGRTFPSNKLGNSRIHTEENDESNGKRVLDPGSKFILQWNRIFLCSCLVALFVDPMFFYLPSVQDEGVSWCILLDLNLRVIATCLRTITDVFYMMHIFIKFRTAYISPSSRVLGRGELVMNSEKIAWRYLKSDFCIDLLATLPLPQIVTWFIIPKCTSPLLDHTTNALVLIGLLQYIPRLYLIFPLSSQIIRATGVVAKTAWAGAAYNLVLYMLASHVLGASWYLLSFERHTACWKTTCQKDDLTNCSLSYLDCGHENGDKWKTWVQVTNLFNTCYPNKTDGFSYGIFGEAVGKGVVSSNFFEKYLYCLWWGLQKLSSYGQTLNTSTFIGETSFALLIAVMGLVLFAHLIGNMQTYLQSITVRLEEWRLRQRDTEQWMKHRQLPRDLQERVRKFVHYKWLATRGVDEESILHALPSDLRRDIQRHLCLDLVRRVPFFSQMDDQLLDAICERLVSTLSTQGTYIVREGDPVSEMLFIIRGRLESSTTNGGRTDFFNSITLRPGDFCGEELLAWALLPKSTLNLPSSTRTVKALSEVEAFALRTEDLKFVANQFRRLHSKKLQHTFRFYSYHWRTWATCFIQAAWRRSRRRRMTWNLSMSESSYCGDRDDGRICETEERHEEAGLCDPNPTKQNLNVTILASRFAANTRRGMLKSKDVEMIKLQKPQSKDVEMIKLQKPQEPDFSADPDDDDD